VLHLSSCARRPSCPLLLRTPAGCIFLGSRRRPTPVGQVRWPVGWRHGEPRRVRALPYMSAGIIADGVMAVSFMPQACATACAAPDARHAVGMAPRVYCAACAVASCSAERQLPQTPHEASLKVPFWLRHRSPLWSIPEATTGLDHRVGHLVLAFPILNFSRHSRAFPAHARLCTKSVPWRCFL
jgi:hypothetical protein